MNLNEIELESFAKINLHLDISGKLDNGFHELFSVFQLISLSDRINIKKINSISGSSENRITIKGNFSCMTEDNLIYKVINDFEDKAGTLNSYEISVDKKIPDGAGLGGGSSNAAYVLYCINKMHGFPLKDSEIIEIAEKNGSDIPFFLKAATAFVKGRGENVEALESDLTDYFLLITCPDFKVSTRNAYNLFDKHKDKDYSRSVFTADQAAERLKMKPEEWGFFNSFTPVLTKEKPVFKEIFRIMKETGSDYYNITGSGSAVFGIFSSITNVLDAENILKTKFPFVWNGRMLAGRPLLDK